MMRQGWRYPCGWACLALVLGGCGAKPRLYPVSGTVRYKNQPVAEAVVSFFSEDGKRLATGRTDANGVFTLSTFREGQGAVPGRHKVTVTKFVTPGKSATGEVSMEDAFKPPQTPPEPRNLLPAKYADPKHPVIELTVSKDRPNDFTIDLAD